MVHTYFYNYSIRQIHSFTGLEPSTRGFSGGAACFAWGFSYNRQTEEIQAPLRVGNNGLGVAGIAWHVKLLPIKALNSQGRGPDSAMVKAILYAADQGASVISMSFGGPGDPGVPEYFQVLVDMATAAEESAASRSRLKVAERHVLVSFGKESIRRLTDAGRWSTGATRR